MSFSAQVKQELCRKDGGCPHCLRAEAYGLLLFGKQFGPDGLQISMEHPEAARRAAQCIAQAAGVMVEVSSRLSRRGKTPGAGLCTVSVEGQDACGQVLSCFGYSGKEAPFPLRTQNFPHTCCLAAMDLKATAILAPTKSGYTAKVISRFRPACPIVALCQSESTRRQLAVSWGVHPYLSGEVDSTDRMFSLAVDVARKERAVQPGETVVITAGVPLGKSGTTNLIKAQVVEEGM